MLKLDYEAFKDCFKIRQREFEEWCKYNEAEVCFDLDEIAGGLVPELTRKLFYARFPQLKDIKFREVGGSKDDPHYYEIDAYSVFEDFDHVDDAYNYFTSLDEEDES